MRTSSPFCIALTGGIGSGKSTVADLFAALGADIIDADLIAHRLTAPHGEAISAIETAFGPGTLRSDGGMDRAAMRQRVFASPPEKRRLEAILHPLIQHAMAQELDASTGTYPLLVVPLLVEGSVWLQRAHRILVVDTEPAHQIDRVMRRNAMERGEVEAIMRSQSGRIQKLAAADDILCNDGDMALLAGKVAQLHRFYTGLAANPCHSGRHCL